MAEMLEAKIRAAAGIEPLDESQVPDEYEVFEESQPAEQLAAALGD
jgi:hypothetical protein